MERESTAGLLALAERPRPRKFGSMVMSQASGAFYYFTHFTLLRYEEMEPSVASRVGSLLQSEGRPLYAVLFPFEEGKLKNLPGSWTHVVSVDDVSIWQCDLGTATK
jgi:hypothetical protein